MLFKFKFGLDGVWVVGFVLLGCGLVLGCGFYVFFNLVVLAILFVWLYLLVLCFWCAWWCRCLLINSVGICV